MLEGVCLFGWAFKDVEKAKNVTGKPHKKLTHAGDSPWPGGFANGL
jgi:hypothetical protein